MTIDCYLTIDFEDFAHDYHRAIGSTANLKSREYALEMSYDSIMETLIRNEQKSVATFFCTGIVAKQHPNLIKKIHKDGHEIACHNYYHDDVNKLTPQEFEKKIILAIDTLTEITGESVLGFRAPRFSVSASDKQHLQIINKYFKYDSSLHFDTLENFQSWAKSSELLEFPVGVTKKKHSGLLIKPGGSYFKLGTLSLINGTICELDRQNIMPIVYLHPYDLISDSSFALRWHEIKGISMIKRLYYFSRQSQWTLVGNHSVENKLNHIFKLINHKGRLDQQLQKNE